MHLSSSSSSSSSRRRLPHHLVLRDDTSTSTRTSGRTSSFSRGAAAAGEQDEQEGGRKLHDERGGGQTQVQELVDKYEIILTTSSSSSSSGAGSGGCSNHDDDDNHDDCYVDTTSSSPSPSTSASTSWRRTTAAGRIRTSSFLAAGTAAADHDTSSSWFIEEKSLLVRNAPGAGHPTSPCCTDNDTNDDGKEEEEEKDNAGSTTTTGGGTTSAVTGPSATGGSRSTTRESSSGSRTKNQILAFRGSVATGTTHYAADDSRNSYEEGGSEYCHRHEEEEQEARDLSDAAEDATNKETRTPQDLVAFSGRVPLLPTSTLSEAIAKGTTAVELDERRMRRVKILEDEISSIKLVSSLSPPSPTNTTSRRGGINKKSISMPAGVLTTTEMSSSTSARKVDTNFNKERLSPTRRLTLASSIMKKGNVYNSVTTGKDGRIMATIVDEDEASNLAARPPPKNDTLLAKSKQCDKKQQDTRIAGTMQYSIRSSSSSPSRRRRSESIDRLYKLGKEKIRSTLPMNARDLERMDAEKLHRLASSPMRTRPERLNHLYSLGKEKNRSRLPLPTKDQEQIMSAESKRLHMLARSALKKTANQQQLERVDRLYKIGKDKIRSSLQASSTAQSKGTKDNLLQVQQQHRLDMERLHRLASSPVRRRSESLDRLYTIGKEKLRSSLPLNVSQKNAHDEQERRNKQQRLAAIHEKNSLRGRSRATTDRLYEIGKERLRLEFMVEMCRRNRTFSTFRE